MKQFALSLIKFLVFFGLGIFLIWLVVKDLSTEEKTQIISQLTDSEADYIWVAIAMAAGLLAHISRAIRWKILLAPLGFFPKTSNTFYAVLIGYMGNLALPRMGEVLRCGILKRYEKIPLTQSFGTVITERAIDLLILLFLFIISIWMEFERIRLYLSKYVIAPKIHAFSVTNTRDKIMLFLCFGIILAVILCLFIFRKRISENQVAKKIRELFAGFFQGIRSVARVKNPLLFVFHSLFIWAMYLLSVYVCVFAFNETKSLTLADCLVLMTFGSLGVIATPGGIGAYQWIILQLMLLWEYSTAIGVAFGWIVWLAQVAIVLIGGLLSLGLLAIKGREM